MAKDENVKVIGQRASGKPFRGVPPKAWRDEWETKLRKTSRNCWIGSYPAGRLSMAVNPDDGLVIPIQAYLLEGMLRVGEPWNTVEKHAYHICIWYDFLRYNNLDIFGFDERHLRNFFIGGAVRYSNVQTINKLIEPSWTATSKERFDAIAAFYDFWQRKRGKRLVHFRGGTIADLADNLFDRANRSSARAKVNFTRPALEKAQRRKGTPSTDEAERVLEKVLEQEDQNRAQTYYLVGSLAYRSGNRSVGASSLTVKNLLQGLMNERDFKGLKDYKKVLKNYHIDGNRKLIVQTLQRMKANRRAFIYCDVRNKGGAEPISLPIPIELCAEIIDYICTYRIDLIRQRYIPKNKAPPDHVFLSYQTEVAGGVLQPETFSNYFGPIFRGLEIDGSLHRLRATFCEEIVRDLYIRERAIHGRNWQASNIIEYARKLLGHKNPDSLEHYLNNVLNQEMISGDPVLVTSNEDTPYIRAMCEELSGPNAAKFRPLLQDFVISCGLEPINQEGRRYALF
ncbi:site-specific integrase [Rhizobium leguminosarum]|uniref:hypothetical protein n=2 Tax=Rhizobium leguminosarum TaxID=384 RepID=UPI001C953B52|nr:hypothetical protein [Rhizobium leguminosarum]MBY5565919.1 site-specific integrase [Rhizobium leguminosarum]